MASLKSQKALSPQPMRVDGTGVDLVDKIVLGLPATAAGAVGTPAAADTIDFRVPAGSQVTGMQFQLDDSDTGTTFVFGVGYRTVSTDDAAALPTNATYFAAAGQTTGQAGGRLVCAFKPITFQVDVYIQLLVGTAPTGIAANPEIWMIASINQNGPK